MTNARRYIVPLVAGMIFGLVLACISKGCKPSSPAKPIVLTDTIRVTDTLRIKEHTKPLYVIKWDTLYLEKPASQDIARDSLCDGYVTIPITQSEYRDTFATDSTRAEVAVLFSGYNARIDSIGINYQATIQPVAYEKESGWSPFVGIGASVGYGLGCKDPLRFEPFIGVTVVVGWGYHWKPKKNTRKNKIEKYVLKNDSIPQNNKVEAIKMKK